MTGLQAEYQDVLDWERMHRPSSTLLLHEAEPAREEPRGGLIDGELNEEAVELMDSISELCGIRHRKWDNKLPLCWSSS